MKNSKIEKLINYDPQGDVLYLGVRDGAEEEFVEVAPGVNVELDDNREVIGIEILNASRIIRSLSKSAKKKALQNV